MDFYQNYYEKIWKGKKGKEQKKLVASLILKNPSKFMRKIKIGLKVDNKTIWNTIKHNCKQNLIQDTKERLVICKKKLLHCSKTFLIIKILSDEKNFTDDVVVLNHRNDRFARKLKKKV